MKVSSLPQSYAGDLARWGATFLHVENPQSDQLQVPVEPENVGSVSNSLSDFWKNYTLQNPAAPFVPFTNPRTANPLAGHQPGVHQPGVHQPGVHQVVANITIDPKFSLALESECATLGIDVGQVLQLPGKTDGAPSTGKVLQGAVLGGAVSAIVHGLKAAGGSAGSPAAVAVTTLGLIAAGAVTWPCLSGVSVSYDPVKQKPTIDFKFGQ